MNWLYGGYPDPWKTILRASFVLFLIAFSANFWSDINDNVIFGITFAIIAFQVIVTWRLRSSAGTWR